MSKKTPIAVGSIVTCKSVDLKGEVRYQTGELLFINKYTAQIMLPGDIVKLTYPRFVKLAKGGAK